MTFVGSMAKWYVAKLKTYPIATNIASAAVLMTAGDVLAQGLEVNQIDHDDKSCSEDLLPMDRYGTHGPVHNFEIENSAISRRKSLSSVTMGTSAAILAPASTLQAAKDELWFWDPFRTATMAAWSVGIYTPFYVLLYRFYDRYLPKQNFITISSRVLMTFFGSIPLNAAFYVYGTLVHHTTEWLSLRNELKYELRDMGCTEESAKDLSSTVPFQWDELLVKCQRKLECELRDTIITSGTCWIPINFFTFTMVPPHLRPLSLMFFSIFWNCYLSLSQHRDLSIPSE